MSEWVIKQETSGEHTGKTQVREATWENRTKGVKNILLVNLETMKTRYLPYSRLSSLSLFGAIGVALGRQTNRQSMRK